MDTLEKLRILAGAARYDASCASSGSTRKNNGRGLGNAATAPMGICHTWAADGRCVSLLKVLLSNHCLYDCAYCANRRSNDLPRASFGLRELVDLTIGFYRRNYIEGLFLSSGIFADPDTTMEILLQAARRLRGERFHGYIHLKIIPGASPALIREAALHADRLSVNVEFASAAALGRLAPDKTREAILAPMLRLGAEIRAHREEAQLHPRAPLFAPAGQSTQLVVGATPETDLQILRLAEWLYRRAGLRRVYYSAYAPVGDRRLLPAPCGGSPLWREHRLYQADWLIRLYGFTAGELFGPGEPFLEPNLDPKTGWALRHPERFPVEVNRADYETLLRVPGIGLLAARRIAAARRRGRLRPEDLPRLGVVMKRAKYFITCDGKAPAWFLDPDALRRRLAEGDEEETNGACRQLSLFHEV